MPDTPTTFEAVLNDKGILSATKKSDLQRPGKKQYFRLFVKGHHVIIKPFNGAPSNSLIKGRGSEGILHVMILSGHSIEITFKNLKEETSRTYFFSYGGNKRTSLKRK